MGCCSSLLSREDQFTSILYVSPADLGFPAPGPPPCRKANLFTSDRYSALDAHVSKINNGLLHKDLRSFTRHITQSAADDLGKVRAIFRWLTTTDIAAMGSEPDKPPKAGSPLEYLLNVRWKVMNHAHVFAALVRSLDIPCVIISGICKNADYHYAAHVDTSKMAAQWNAVYVQGSWRLVDTYWASLSITERHLPDWAVANADGEIVKADIPECVGKISPGVNEFYFLTDPDMFICTHLPDDMEWQLLPAAVARGRFETSVYLREQFFLLGMTIEEPVQKQVVLNTKNGEVTLRLHYQEGRGINYSFKYLLFKHRESCKKLKNQTLRGVVFAEIRPNGVSYTIRLPAAGRFRLDVFGVDTSTQNRFDLVCTYVIACDKPAADFRPLPDSPEIGWGPGSECLKAGLIPITHKGAVIDTKDGTLRIRFQMKEQLSVQVQLKHNELDDWQLEPHSLVQYEDGEVIIDCRLPASGRYALNVMARPDGEHNAAHCNVCNYLVDFSGAPPRKNNTSLKPYPRITKGTLGSREGICEQLAVRPSSHFGGGAIETPDGVLDIRFYSPRPDVQLVVELTHVQVEADRLYVPASLSREDREWVFHLKLPFPGEYGLNVFASCVAERHLMHPAHDYLIQFRNTAVAEQEKQTDPAAIKPPKMPPTHKTRVDVEVIKTVSAEAALTYAPPSTLPVLAMFEEKFSARDPKSANVTVKKHESTVDFDIKLPNFGSYLLDIYQQVKEGFISLDKSYRVLRGEDFWVEGERPNDAKITARSPQMRRRTVGDKISDAAMRAQLKVAMATKMTYHLLCIAIKQYEKNGGKDLDLLNRAKRERRIEKMDVDMSVGMREAVEGNGSVALERALDNVDRADPAETKRLGFKVIVARRMLLRKLGEQVGKMEAKMVAEIKSYLAPPPSAFSIMKATLLLLGHNQSELTDWESVRHHIGDTQKMKQRIREVDVKAIDTQAVTAARALLGPYTKKEARQTSEMVAVFYTWSKHLIKLEQPEF